MKNQLRLDKFLADMGIGTRSEVKGYIRKGRVCVNGATVKSSDLKVDLKSDSISFDSRLVEYSVNEYIMLNKPMGVVSATEDNTCETVIDLIQDSYRKDLFPVGRLDKDTEGLLILTNDGVLSHNLLSPRKHVSKVYYAKIDQPVTEKEVTAFREGIRIDDEFTALPAELKVLSSSDVSEIELTIYEGKFHQVKRMFEAVGMNVIYLKRIAMGNLVLDHELIPGEYRELSEEEIELLRNS